MEFFAKEIRRAVRAALAEDIGGGDVTTLATVPAKIYDARVMRAREPLIVAGIRICRNRLPRSRKQYFRRESTSPISRIVNQGLVELVPPKSELSIAFPMAGA